MVTTWKLDKCKSRTLPSKPHHHDLRAKIFGQKFLLKLGVLSSKRINLGVHQGNIDPRVADQVGMLHVDVLKIAANEDYYLCSFFD